MVGPGVRREEIGARGRDGEADSWGILIDRRLEFSREPTELAKGT